MSTELIEENAESALLALVEQCNRHNASIGALLFRFSEIGIPEESDLLLPLHSILDGRHPSAVHRLMSGDIVITWSGVQKAVVDRLCDALYGRFAPEHARNLHRYFDIQAHGEELRLLVRDRLSFESQVIAVPISQSPSTPQAEAAVSSLAPTAPQLAQFRRALKQRPRRRHPEILIVEDQAFSGRLLLGMLQQQHCKVQLVADAETGLELYTKQAPDILYLDIELPASSGHDFAAIVGGFDKDAFIVMVTGNHHVTDVERAKANGARGFIVKPYSKQKILDTLNLFRQERKAQG